MPIALGKVYLVGAGPGDPELLTLKAHRLLATAGAVLYDNLANSALLALAPTTAERIYVGKKRAAHQYPQAEIDAMLIERARQGQTVVRLKGGDPYLFGRGGEEAEALADAGIAFEVVPGVASMSGLAAYAGIPLTHRQHSSSVTVVTGHDPAAIDWNRTGQADTLVLLMAITSFGRIADLLTAAGRSPETPAVAVRWATRPEQQTLTGTLRTLPRLLIESGMKPPATIVVGEVAALHPKLNWFERLPLFGQRVLNTRPAGQNASLTRALIDQGAAVTEQPAIETSPLPDYAELDRAIARLQSFAWIIFTSANAVRYFLERLRQSPNDLRALRGQIAAVGPATRAALEALHLKVAVTGEEFVAESLLAALPSQLADVPILLPRAADARDVLPEGLRARGALVEIAAAYRTGAPANLPVLMQAAFARLRPQDWVAFASSSAVQATVTAVGAPAIRNVRVATIGPVTSATAREFGIEPAAEASIYTTAGIVDALLRMG